MPSGKLIGSNLGWVSKYDHQISARYMCRFAKSHVARPSDAQLVQHAEVVGEAIRFYQSGSRNYVTPTQRRKAIKKIRVQASNLLKGNPSGDWNERLLNALSCKVEKTGDSVRRNRPISDWQLFILLDKRLRDATERKHGAKYGLVDSA